MDWGDIGVAFGRTIRPSSERMGEHRRSIRGELRFDGLGGACFVRRASAGAVAGRRAFHRASDSGARPILERVLPCRVSEHVAGSRGCVRGLDALLLRGCVRGRVDSSAKSIVKKRPNLLAGEKLLPEPRQKRSIQKREHLKSAGLLLFGEKGYDNTSIDDIARRANLAVGTFYQHFHSKRQLLLALMDELLEKLSQLSLRPTSKRVDIRGVIHDLLSGAFSHDLRYLGAYRAWQEAVLSDANLARKQNQIQEWTTFRVATVFEVLQGLPGARKGVDVPSLARAMDSFFWNLLGQATRMRKVELDRWVGSSTHLIYHALFIDVPMPVGRNKRA